MEFTKETTLNEKQRAFAYMGLGLVILIAASMIGDHLGSFGGLFVTVALAPFLYFLVRGIIILGRAQQRRERDAKK